MTGIKIDGSEALICGFHEITHDRLCAGADPVCEHFLGPALAAPGDT